jgi:hypothetical protein
VRYAGKDNTAAFHGEQHPVKAAEVLDEVRACRALLRR